MIDVKYGKQYIVRVAYSPHIQEKCLQEIMNKTTFQELVLRAYCCATDFWQLYNLQYSGRRNFLYIQRKDQREEGIK